MATTSGWIMMGLMSLGLFWIYIEMVYRVVLPAYLDSSSMFLAWVIWTETWCVAFAIISLYRVLATGPGFVSPIYHPPNGEIDPVAEDYAIEPCISCRAYRPQRAVHCRICNRCVLRHEFHSNNLGVCIGHRNYKYYILFLWNGSCVAFNAYCAFSYWWMSHVVWGASPWFDALTTTPNILYISLLGTASFWTTAVLVYTHAQCWGAMLGNTTWSELGFYRKYMIQKTRAEKEHMQTLPADIFKQTWNRGHAYHQEYMPVWPYDTNSQMQNVCQILGNSVFWWFWPIPPTPHSDGTSFPISQEWFQLNLQQHERQMFVYSLSADEMLAQLAAQESPSVLAILQTANQSSAPRDHAADAIEIDMS